MTKKIQCVMLVDDNKIDNFFHERIIKKHDASIEVLLMPFAEEALEYLKVGEKQQPELIFLDINMPGMNGWEFLEEYHKLPNENQQSMIVVMLTTSENPDDRAKALTHGILSDFRSKPLTKEMFEEVIDIYNQSLNN